MDAWEVWSCGAIANPRRWRGTSSPESAESERDDHTVKLVGSSC
jgi:hypothetical protein